jgi:hypothetical protein
MRRAAGPQYHLLNHTHCAVYRRPARCISTTVLPVLRRNSRALPEAAESPPGALPPGLGVIPALNGHPS